ncbi:hypothetical protein [Desulfosporosinus sp. OT]|uniref:hypothetical protein n=1 Tax=Desulfosporosinus sp. OT TaxID=913865 RepID=UPI000223A8D5|nr:hypothetical protein [Desulfosporosinus sp. OT]EGW39789.1 hypothetical protein DOT_2005 [Desulfosporosinus sp. OT]
MKNRTVSFDKELLLNIMKLDNFEMRIAMLAFYQDGQVTMSFSKISKLGELAGLTQEGMLLKEIFGYDFNNTLKYASDDENEVTVFWVNRELL